jgi:hypothetical protein
MAHYSRSGPPGHSSSPVSANPHAARGSRWGPVAHPVAGGRGAAGAGFGRRISWQRLRGYAPGSSGRAVGRAAAAWPRWAIPRPYATVQVMSPRVTAVPTDGDTTRQTGTAKPKDTEAWGCSSSIGCGEPAVAVLPGARRLIWSASQPAGDGPLEQPRAAVAAPGTPGARNDCESAIASSEPMRAYAADGGGRPPASGGGHAGGPMTDTVTTGRGTHLRWRDRAGARDHRGRRRRSSQGPQLRISNRLHRDDPRLRGRRRGSAAGVGRRSPRGADE